MSEFSIRKNQSRDLPQILDFCRSNNEATPRTKESWRGNKMVSMNLWRGRKMVGIIPLEPRRFKISKDFSIRTLWHTAVYIIPELRSQGFGAQMVRKLVGAFSPKFDGVFVHRHDEKSPAYRWYQKTGHYHLLPILSLKLPKEKFKNSPEFTDFSIFGSDGIASHSRGFHLIFNKYYRDYGGFQLRNKNFWKNRLQFHYYKDKYSYSAVVRKDGGRILSYAILGRTDLHDKIDRIDILEFVSPPANRPEAERLIRAIVNYAKLTPVKEIRMNISVQSPHLMIFQKNNFQNRWRTNILGFLFKPTKIFQKRVKGNSKFSKEYCVYIETPNLSIFRAGKGKKRIRLFMEDYIFHRLLLHRCNIFNAIREGRIVCLEGDDEDMSKFAKIFPLTNWIFHQFDTI